jgi:hypothetical protein
MRALRGAIITAGALIGLGLTALGIGTRYSGPAFGPEVVNINSHSPWGLASLMLMISLLIGLAIAFLGLAFHHYRRYHEHLRASGSREEAVVS